MRRRRHGGRPVDLCGQRIEVGDLDAPSRDRSQPLALDLPQRARQRLGPDAEDGGELLPGHRQGEGKAPGGGIGPTLGERMLGESQHQAQKPLAHGDLREQQRARSLALYVEQGALAEQDYIEMFELSPRCSLYLGSHVYDEPNRARGPGSPIATTT